MSFPVGAGELLHYLQYVEMIRIFTLGLVEARV